MPVLPSEKTITVKVENKWLDAMEDYLFCHLTDEEIDKNRKEMTKLWKVLAREYSKKAEGVKLNWCST